MADLHGLNGVIFLVDSDGDTITKDQAAFMYIDTEGKLNFSENTVEIKNVSGTTLKSLVST